MGFSASPDANDAMPDRFAWLSVARTRVEPRLRLARRDEIVFESKETPDGQLTAIEVVLERVCAHEALQF
jgi:hypothetical protein